MYKMSTVSAQEQNSSWTAAMSQQGNSSTATSGATTAKTVTVLRTGGPKSATSKAATNSKSIRVIKISKLVAQSKKVMDMGLGIGCKRRCTQCSSSSRTSNQRATYSEQWQR